MASYTIKRFLKEFNEKKVYYDPRFQRRVVWDKNNTNKYFKSLTRGWAVTPIVVLDVESCIEYSESLGDESSVDYFENTRSKGYKYISLDGQNRTKHIEMVNNNAMTISGNLKDADGKFHEIDNKFLKDMEQRLIDHIVTICNVSVVVVKEATRSDAADIFQALNDGEPLNDQEKRQAIDTPIADFIRELSKLRETTSKRILQEKKISRMEDDETYAKIMMVLFRKYRIDGEIIEKQYDLSKSSIDEFYALGLGFSNINDPQCPYLPSEIKRAKNIIKMFSSAILHQTKVPKSKLVPRKNWWAVLSACAWVYDNNYKIESYREFYDCLKNIDDKLATQSETQYSQCRNQMIATGQDPDQVTKQNYYFRWQQLPHQPGPRAQRKKALIGEVKNNLNGLTIRMKSTMNKAA
tara:strand:- start:54 stop:1280 length:1227 start_codon:yes stop_codon:yes gene_type:complete